MRKYLSGERQRKTGSVTESAVSQRTQQANLPSRNPGLPITRWTL